MSDETGETPLGSADRLPWERPALTWLGNVKDLVKGATKQSGNADSDGTSVRKPPLPG